MIRRLGSAALLGAVLAALPAAAAAPAPTALALSVPPAAAAAGETGGAGPETRVALAELNRARTHLGLPPVTYSPVLAAAARNHLQYLVANPSAHGTDPHGERPGNPGFTGVNVLARAEHAGYRGGGAAEVIARDDLAERAVWNWLATPYHRLPLTARRAVSAGLAATGGEGALQVMNLAMERRQGGSVVLFPAPGQTGVPTGWSGMETPNPLRFFPGARGPLGFTVTAIFPGRVNRLSLDTARLDGPDGQVEVYLLTPDRDEYLPDGIALLPRAPLAGLTTYRVTLQGRADWGQGLQPIDLKWEFTTGHREPRAHRARWSMQSGVVASVTLEGSGFLGVDQAFLGGVPVRDLQVESDGVLRFQVPGGVPAGPVDLVLSGPGGDGFWPGLFPGDEALPGGGATATWTARLASNAGLQAAGAPALVAGDGAGADGLLLPGEVITALGGSLERDGATGRWLISLGARWAVAGGAGARAWVGSADAPHLGEPVSLPRPALERDGRLYFPAPLAARLGASLLVDPAARSVTVVAAGTLFPDTLGHWARPTVLALHGRGAVSGYPDGTFRPDEPLARGALVRLMDGAGGLPPRPGPLPGPALVPAGHWLVQQGWLQAALAAGLVVPAEHPGGLRPEEPASRLELAVMAIRALGLEAEAGRRSGAALDARWTDGAAVPPAFRGHVVLAVERGILSGFPEPGGRFSLRLGEQATRAQAAAVIQRLLGARA